MAEPQPHRALPARPSIEFLKKTAKERLVALKAANPAAQLAEAQLALAREHGFPSWRALVAKIAADQAQAQTPSPSDQSPVDEALQKIHRQFRGAVNGGRVEEVRQLLEVNPDLANAPIFEFNKRAISHATHNPAMLDLLQAHGADINLKSAWWAGGWGVLDDADEQAAGFLIQRGAIVDIFAATHLNRLDRMRELLDANPELVHAKGGDGCRPLHFARTAQAADLLLSRGADIDARDVDHEATAAQWAVPRPPGQGPASSTEKWARMEQIRLLVGRGASVDVFMAAALGDFFILKTILDHDPEAINRRVGDAGYPLCPVAPGKHIYVYSLVNKTPFQIAAEFGNQACVDLLIERSTPRQRFLAACATGNEPFARQALAADPGLVASLAPAEHALLSEAAWAGNASAVKLMLDLGFDSAAPGPDTDTALHCAAWQGRHEIVRLILSHPSVQSRRAELVNVVEPTHHGVPLGWCCHGSSVCRNPDGDYPAVAVALLEAGAKPRPNMAADATAAVRAVIVGWVER